MAASGFALREQSGSALGNAFAGATAGAEDISYMFFNPAGLTRHQGSQIAATTSLIVPQARFHSGSGSTAGGTPIRGSNGGGDVTEDMILPAFYAMWDAQRDLGLSQNVRLGVGVNAPYGLETEYEEQWIGRYHALHSHLETVNVNPVVAWEALPGLSIGGGVQFQYVDAKLTNAVDFGTIGAAVGVPGLRPTQADGWAKVDGDDYGWGYNFGVLYEPWVGTRVGAAYRSAIHHRLDGDERFSNVPAPLRGTFRNTSAEAALDLPETVSFGIHQDISNSVSVMGEAAWTRWSRFNELRITFDNTPQPESMTEEEWEDTWFFALGATWRPDDQWALKLGIAYDEDPVPDRTRTPRVPSSDRKWISVGATYEPFSNLKLDIGYTHVFFDEASIDLPTSAPGNTFRGNLEGKVEASVDIIAVQAQLAF